MLPSLSDREQEVIDHLLQGKSNKQIAAALTISIRTVEFHLKNIYEKFQVSSRTELILKLGNTPGSEKLGYSTVVGHPKLPENADQPKSEMNWQTSLRETFSLIGKEFSKMSSFINTTAGTNPMTFQESIRVCLTKYADFNGQATRPEFWWFALFVTLVAGAFGYIHEAAASIFMIAVLLPFLAVGARRLHDTGRSAWWLLFILVPVGGLVALAWLWAMPGTAEPATD